MAHRRHARLPARARQVARRRLRLEHAGRLSPYWTPGSRRGDPGGQRRPTRRPRARRDGQRRREPAGDRDHRPGLDGRADGPRRPERRRLAAAPLEPRRRTRRSASRGSIPLQWPTTIRLLDAARRRHRPRSSPTRRRWTGSAPRSSASSQREDERHQDRDHTVERRMANQLLRLAGDDLPLDLRRGPRELPGGRRRGDRHLGVQARRGPVNGRRVRPRSSATAACRRRRAFPGTLSVFPVPFPGRTIRRSGSTSSARRSRCSRRSSPRSSSA